MQLCCLHANSFSFEVRDHDPASDTPAEGPVTSVDGCIVVLAAVETVDRNRTGTVTTSAADRIHGVTDQLNETTVAVFPCTQLTDQPASDSVARDTIEALAEQLDGDTHTVPFAESVAFDLDVRGHPFAIQQFRIDSTGQSAGEWSRLSPDGSLDSIETAELDEPRRSLRQDGELTAPLSPEHCFEPSETGPAVFTDEGVLLPAGVMLRELLVEFATDRLFAYGASPIEQFSRNNAGQDGLAALASTLEPTELPLSLSETDKRTGPTLTTVVAATANALPEFDKQAALLSQLLTELSLDFEPIVHTSDEFYDQHRDWFTDLAERVDQPVLLERRPAANCDWRLKLEFTVHDEYGARLVSPAVWIEDGQLAEPAVENGDGPWAVRSMPLGNPSRLVATLCRTRAAMERPQLPTWLSPTQIRLIPLDSTAIETCEQLGTELDTAGVRVDIDDRELPVGERLRGADEEWIPYDAVVGPAESDQLSVTIRAAQTEQQFTPAGLAERIDGECANRPRARLPVPRRYSERPAFLQSL